MRNLLSYKLPYEVGTNLFFFPQQDLQYLTAGVLNPSTSGQQPIQNQTPAACANGAVRACAHAYHLHRIIPSPHG